jgi:hypothetical protein
LRFVDPETLFWGCFRFRHSQHPAFIIQALILGFCASRSRQYEGTRQSNLGCYSKARPARLCRQRASHQLTPTVSKACPPTLNPGCRQKLTPPCQSTFRRLSPSTTERMRASIICGMCGIKDKTHQRILGLFDPAENQSLGVVSMRYLFLRY